METDEHTNSDLLMWKKPSDLTLLSEVMKCCFKSATIFDY